MSSDSPSRASALAEDMDFSECTAAVVKGQQPEFLGAALLEGDREVADAPEDTPGVAQPTLLAFTQPSGALQALECPQGHLPPPNCLPTELHRDFQAAGLSVLLSYTQISPYLLRASAGKICFTSLSTY